MRIAFALAMYLSLRSNWPGFESQSQPHGLGQWIDFSFLGSAAVMQWLEPLRIIALAVFALGVAPVLTLGMAAFIGVGAGTLMNSQGAIGHSTQLMSMTALAQWAVYIWWAAARQRTATGWLLPDAAGSGNATADWAKVIIAAGYTVSGVAKWIFSDGEWLERAPFLSLQVIKASEMDYYNRLERDSGFWVSEFPAFLANHPLVAQALFGAGFFLELLAFLALLGRGWALAFGLGLIGLHLSVSVMMRLHFEDHILLLAIFFVNPVWWIWRIAAGHWQRRPETTAP